MTEHGWRWSAQVQLMGDEFSKHRLLGQECRRLLEAAEKTVSRSFLCLGFVVSQSVIVPGVNAGVYGELKSRKHLMMASGVRWRCLCFVNK